MTKMKIYIFAFLMQNFIELYELLKHRDSFDKEKKKN